MTMGGAAIAEATSDGVSYSNGIYSALASANAINLQSASTSIVATALTEVTSTSLSGTQTAIADGDYVINGISIGAVASAASPAARVTDLIAAINAKTTLGTATATGHSTYLYSQNHGSGLTLNGFVIAAPSADGISTSQSANSALASATAINLKTVNTSVTATAKTEYTSFPLSGIQTAIADGDYVINGTSIGALSLAASPAARVTDFIAAVNDPTRVAATGVTAAPVIGVATKYKLTAADGRNIFFTSAIPTSSNYLFTGTIAYIGSSPCYIGQVTLTSNSAFTIGGTIPARTFTAGTYGAGTGVTAAPVSGDTSKYTLTAADGRNIDLSTALSSTHAPYLGLSFTSSSPTDYYGQVSLTSSSAFTIGGSVPANNLTAGDYGIVGRVTQTSASLSVSTQSDSTASITLLDAAISTVNSQRGNIGAMQTRFDSVIANLQTSSDNVSAARSRIRDADFAVESASLTRNQILQQAGIAMLAQANALPNIILSLLKGSTQ
jgi:flagellin